MKAASENIKEIFKPGLPQYHVYFLTGKDHFFQTAFCLSSFQKATNAIQINAIFVDDGSIDGELTKRITARFPHSEIMSASEIKQLLNKHLPESKFPSLRKRRLVYPHLRKLTDIHLLPGKWKLVLDSDMLFLSEPTELLTWLNNPRENIVMQDVETAYGYPEDLMQHLTGRKITDKINVGVVGLESDRIDWQELEKWLHELQRREGDHYYQEQALTTMLLSKMPHSFLDADKYKVLPDAIEIETPKATLHHYVAASKTDYFTRMWQKVNV